MKKRIYICGPMTGLPEFNYPAFNAEAKRLRELGYHVENPAENEHPADQTWAGYMRAALRQMLTCDAVAVLDGWASSKDAKLELDVAEAVGIPISYHALIRECGDAKISP